VAFRDFQSGRKSWFRESSWFDLLTVRRTLPARDGGPSLLHFDGAVMRGYAHPSRASEVVFCRGKPDDFYCKNGHGFDPARPDLPESVEVRASSLGEHAGRGVFATQDIPWLSYVNLKEAVHAVHMNGASLELASKMYDRYEEGHIGGFIVAMYGWSYGEVLSHHVSEHRVVLLCGAFLG
jgi:hypothetical protein